MDACVQYATGAQKVSTWLRTIRVRALTAVCVLQRFCRRVERHDALGVPALKEYDDAKLEAANLPSEGALVREGQQLIAFDESVFSRMIFENICAGAP